VPGTHDDAVALGGQDLARAVRADERLAAALPGQPAVDAPGLGEPAIVVDGDLAVLEEAVADAQGVAAAVFAGPAGIGDGLVHLDAKREVALEELVGHVREVRPQGMAVGAVAEGPSRYAAEADLVELVPLAAAVITRVHEVRAVGEAGGAQEVRVALAEQAADDVEDAAERVRAAGERGGVIGL